MKIVKVLTAIFLALALLAGCAQPAPQAPADGSVSDLADPPAGTPAPGSQDTLSDSGSESTDPAASLQFYDSFRDIPFAGIEYGTYQDDGSVNKNSLCKDGEDWCAAPGQMAFGERCFTDGTTLWIQVYLLPGEGFDWFQVCFNHFGEAENVWMAPLTAGTDKRVTQDRLFTHADGYTVYTDDGFSFTVEPCAP